MFPKNHISLKHKTSERGRVWCQSADGREFSWSSSWFPSTMEIIHQSYKCNILEYGVNTNQITKINPKHTTFLLLSCIRLIFAGRLKNCSASCELPPAVLVKYSWIQRITSSKDTNMSVLTKNISELSSIKQMSCIPFYLGHQHAFNAFVTLFCRLETLNFCHVQSGEFTWSFAFEEQGCLLVFILGWNSSLFPSIQVRPTLSQACRPEETQLFVRKDK